MDELARQETLDERTTASLHRTGVTRTVLREPLATTVERFSVKFGKRPDEVPHLLDVMFRFAAMEDRYAELTLKHEQFKKHHFSSLERRVIEYDRTKSVIAQVFIPVSLDYLMAVEGFLSEARRLVTQVLLLLGQFHAGRPIFPNFSLKNVIKRLTKSAPAKNDKDSLPAILMRCSPEVTKSLVNGWDGWLGKLTHDRDQLEHMSRTPVDLYNHVGWTCPGG